MNQTCYLINDAFSFLNPRKVYAKAGQQIELIHQLDVLAVVDLNGERFAARKDNLQYTPINNEKPPAGPDAPATDNKICNGRWCRKIGCAH